VGVVALLRGVPPVFRAARGGASFDTLARKCQISAREEWASIIAEHLQIALSPDPAELTRALADFEVARHCLKVQVLSEHQLLARWENGVNYRLVAPGLAAVLCCDLPKCVELVEPRQVRGWKKSLDELMAIAVENVRNDPGLRPLEREVQESGCVIYRLEGDTHFVCAQLLWLERFPELKQERGVIVSVPSRHLLQLGAVADGRAMEVLQILALAGMTLYSRLPGAITDTLYFIRGNERTPIPVKRHDSGQIEILAPKHVLAALQEGA
jgi:hypothetical protein